MAQEKLQSQKWRGTDWMKSHVGAKDYTVKMRSKTKTYHVNMLKKYIAREPKVDVVPTNICMQGKFLTN